MRHYFVAFQYELLDSGIIRFENCEITIKTKRDIVTYSDVEELLISQIQELLKQKVHSDFTVCILRKTLDPTILG